MYALNSTTDDEDVSVAITSYRGRVSFGVTAVAPLRRWARDIGDELGTLRSEV